MFRHPYGASGLAPCAIRDLAQAGVTMVELMVTIFVFSIFLAIVLSSLVGITKASTQAQVISRSSTGVLNVFQNFDRAIRYADVINAPGSTVRADATSSSAFPAKDAASVATCIQWRYVPDTKSHPVPSVAGWRRPGTRPPGPPNSPPSSTTAPTIPSSSSRRAAPASADAAAQTYHRRGQCHPEGRAGHDELRRAQQQRRLQHGRAGLLGGDDAAMRMTMTKRRGGNESAVTRLRDAIVARVRGEHSESGVALLSAILFMIIMAGISVVLLSTVLGQIVPSTLAQRNTKTIYAAQAGRAGFAGHAALRSRSTDVSGKTSSATRRS